MARTITTTLSPEFHDLGKEFNLSWNEALKIGLAILFAERGVKKFKNPLSINRLNLLLEKLNADAVDESIETNGNHN